METVPITLLLFTAAFILILAGVLLLLLSTLKAVQNARRIEGGAVLIIGPVPLVIGTSEKVARSLIAIAILFTAFSVAVFLLIGWLLR
ncbi:MAG: DUF131 domain-containing protein [Thermofilaceae archaeon]